VKPAAEVLEEARPIMIAQRTKLARGLAISPPVAETLVLDLIAAAPSVVQGMRQVSQGRPRDCHH